MHSLSCLLGITISLYQQCVSKHRARYINIGKISANAIGEDTCKALPWLHVFMGCDSVSVFARIGKVQTLKLMRKNKDFQSTLQRILGEDWLVSPEFYKGFESFVRAPYHPNKGKQDVNECRYITPYSLRRVK